MVLVVLGIDALDPELVDPANHPNLTLDTYQSIETINSVEGEPSTHELWPTIITGLAPKEHGLKLEDGVAGRIPRYGTGVRPRATCCLTGFNPALVRGCSTIPVKTRFVFHRPTTKKKGSRRYSTGVKRRPLASRITSSIPKMRTENTAFGGASETCSNVTEALRVAIHHPTRQRFMNNVWRCRWFGSPEHEEHSEVVERAS